MVSDQSTPPKPNGPAGFRVGLRAHGRRLGVAVAILALVGYVTYSIGLDDAREIVGSAGFLSGVDQGLGELTGVVISIVLGIVALVVFRKHRFSAALIACAVAVGWIGFVAGTAMGTSQGPGVSYIGSETVTSGALSPSQFGIRCDSVTGDINTIAAIYADGGLDLGLKDRVSHDPARYVDWGGSPNFKMGNTWFVLGSVDGVNSHGLQGEATVSATLLDASNNPSGPAAIHISWTCDPATLGPAQ